MNISSSKYLDDKANQLYKRGTVVILDIFAPQFAKVLQRKGLQAQRKPYTTKLCFGRVKRVEEWQYYIKCD